jgi:hypothetical protein
MRLNPFSGPVSFQDKSARYWVARRFQSIDEQNSLLSVKINCSISALMKSWTQLRVVKGRFLRPARASMVGKLSRFKARGGLNGLEYAPMSSQ